MAEVRIAQLGEPPQPIAEEAEAALLPLRQARLADQVYELLLLQIARGAYRVGTRLPSEPQLCTDFGVSRPVVREALARLRVDNIVRSRRGSGTWVEREPSHAFAALAPSGTIAEMVRAYEFRASWALYVDNYLEGLHIPFLHRGLDAKLDWPRQIAGRPMDTYHRWMETVTPWTLAGCPVISVPVGFGAAGLPMGMQLIGPPRGGAPAPRACPESALAPSLPPRPWTPPAPALGRRRGGKNKAKLLHGALGKAAETLPRFALAAPELSPGAARPNQESTRLPFASRSLSSSPETPCRLTSATASLPTPSWFTRTVVLPADSRNCTKFAGFEIPGW